MCISLRIPREPEEEAASSSARHPREEDAWQKIGARIHNAMNQGKATDEEHDSPSTTLPASSPFRTDHELISPFLHEEDLSGKSTVQMGAVKSSKAGLVTKSSTGTENRSIGRQHFRIRRPRVALICIALITCTLSILLSPRIAQRDCRRANVDLRSESRSEPDALPVRGSRTRRMESK
jgi:hypothetical protein